MNATDLGAFDKLIQKSEEFRVINAAQAEEFRIANGWRNNGKHKFSAQTVGRQGQRNGTPAVVQRFHAPVAQARVQLRTEAQERAAAQSRAHDKVWKAKRTLYEKLRDGTPHGGRAGEPFWKKRFGEIVRANEAEYWGALVKATRPGLPEDDLRGLLEHQQTVSHTRLVGSMYDAVNIEEVPTEDELANLGRLVDIALKRKVINEAQAELLMIHHAFGNCAKHYFDVEDQASTRRR